MTAIKVTCRGCGDVTLTAADLELDLSEDGDAYLFDHCGMYQRRQADARTKAVLLAVGVRDIVQDFALELYALDHMPASWS